MGRFQPALLGALFIGVLSSLPIVNAANMCCCLWVVAGGVLATYLLQQNTPTPVATGEAAIQGLIAGALGGLIYCLVQFAIVSFFAGPDVLAQIRAELTKNTEIPPEMRDRILGFMNGRNLVLLGLFVTLPIYSVFSMAGSFLGLAFFRKKLPPTPQA
ncbi:MAG TPA: hypothetical protein VN700_10285 [Vicinamibacterales bacterium]|nr:hypothetical protein [Vicinamibacterales bacterium]